MTRSFWAPAVLAVVAGLVVLLAAGAGWVDGVDTRDVGGVVLEEPVSTSGSAFAPLAVVLGLGGLAGGALLAVLRGVARRTVGGIVGVTGIAAAVVVGTGIATATAQQGTLTPAPFFALLGTLGLAVAGGAALRAPQRPPAAGRYRVEAEQAGDDEWSLAAGEDEQDG